MRKIFANLFGTVKSQLLHTLQDLWGSALDLVSSETDDTERVEHGQGVHVQVRNRCVMLRNGSGRIRVSKAERLWVAVERRQP